MTLQIGCGIVCMVGRLRANGHFKSWRSLCVRTQRARQCSQKVLPVMKLPTPRSTTTLIKGAAILTMDRQLGDIPRGDILVEDGVISAIGPNLDRPGVDEIDATGMIAIPGFVDTHRHLWQSLIRSSLPDATL